jgi:hypothetical protein
MGTHKCSLCLVIRWLNHVLTLLVSRSMAAALVNCLSETIIQTTSMQRLCGCAAVG